MKLTQWLKSVTVSLLSQTQETDYCRFFSFFKQPDNNVRWVYKGLRNLIQCREKTLFWQIHFGNFQLQCLIKYEWVSVQKIILHRKYIRIDHHVKIIFLRDKNKWVLLDDFTE